MILSLLISFYYMKKAMHFASGILLTLRAVAIVPLFLPTLTINIWKKKIKFGNQKTNTQTNKNPTQLTSFCNGLDFLPGQAHTYKISPFCQQVSCMPFTPIEAKEKTLCMSALLQIFLLSTPAPSLNVLCLGCCFDVASGNFETITWRQH